MFENHVDYSFSNKQCFYLQPFLNLNSKNHIPDEILAVPDSRITQEKKSDGYVTTSSKLPASATTQENHEPQKLVLSEKSDSQYHGVPFPDIPAPFSPFHPETGSALQNSANHEQVPAEAAEQTSLPLGNIRKRMTVYGALFNTYIMIEYDDCLLLIDQHAVHERILFDRFSDACKKGQAGQPLLVAQARGLWEISVRAFRPLVSGLGNGRLSQHPAL